MPNSRFKVIAADDHPVVLSGIRLALRECEDFTLLAEARDAATTLAAIEREVPDLLILDHWMEGNDGIELLSQVHKRWPSIRVLIYSMNDERSYGARALRAGAAGYLMKSSGLEELLEALRRVAAGERYVSPDLAAELINAGLRPLPDDPALVPELAALTNREIQILRLIGRGHSTSMIARELSISAKTVGAHRENLKNKLGTNSSAELARRAFQLVESRVL
jgi:DNA-binding NarL/FixJ family response regulator